MADLFWWAEVPHPRPSSAPYENPLSLYLTVPRVCRTQRLPPAHQEGVRPLRPQARRTFPVRSTHPERESASGILPVPAPAQALLAQPDERGQVRATLLLPRMP